MTLGTDSTSMGPLPDLAEPTHYAGLKHGMIWTESNIGLGALPPTGAFYCILSPKYAGGIYSECRAFAIVGDPLARPADRLGSQEERRGSVGHPVRRLAPVTWPGRGVGTHRQPFVKVRLWPQSQHANARSICTCSTATPARTWSRRPTPCPRDGFDNTTYASRKCKSGSPNMRKCYGRRGTSDTTTEKVPLSQTCGPARVIDVRHLIGSTDREELASFARDHGRRHPEG